MNYVWGVLMAGIGMFMSINAYRKSEFILYKFLVARSKLFWGEHVHSFILVAGVLLVGLSSLFFLGIWG